MISLLLLGILAGGPAELARSSPGPGMRGTDPVPSGRTVRTALAPPAEAWREGMVYRLETAPERISDIALQPGEVLVAVAAGDTARWVIGDTASGSGGSRRSHVLVKPVAAGLRTNLVIATDRRVYHLELRSGREATSLISWTYPESELIALAPDGSAQRAPELVAVGLERLNFGYAIVGDAPWRPVRAFDDGRRVFIQFPPGLATGEAPPLFALGRTGKPELLNYRKHGLYYIVDRLFEAAELRLGEKRQQVVRIRRSSQGNGR